MLNHMRVLLVPFDPHEEEKRKEKDEKDKKGEIMNQRSVVGAI